MTVRQKKTEKKTRPAKFCPRRASVYVCLLLRAVCEHIGIPDVSVRNDRSVLTETAVDEGHDLSARAPAFRDIFSGLLDICWTRNNKVMLLRTDITDRKDLTDAYL